MSTVAPAGSSVSAARKAAVDGITKSLAKELGLRKIHVNSVNPGVVMTEGFISAGLADSPMEKHNVERLWWRMRVLYRPIPSLPA